MQKAKDGGLDVIQTYVFWNGHEPSPGNVIFHLLCKLGFYVLFHALFNGVFSLICSIILRRGMIWSGS